MSESHAKAAEALVIDLEAMTPEDPRKPHGETRDRAHSGPSVAAQLADVAARYANEPTPGNRAELEALCTAFAKPVGTTG